MSYILPLLVSAFCLIGCGPSRIPVQETRPSSTEPSQENEKDTQPRMHPFGKKPETEPPEGLTTVVAPAEIREPEAKYETAGSKATGAFHIIEVPVSLERPDVVSSRVRHVLSAHLDRSPSTEDLMLSGSQETPAVGLNHVAEPVEQGIRFRSKDGSTEWVLEPAEVLANSVSATRDLRVFYDGFAGRYVIVGLKGMTDESGPDLSQILVTVSDDGRPEGEWYNAKLGLQEEAGSSGDPYGFYGFAVDAESIYILLERGGEDRGRENLGVSVWTIDKGLETAGFYSGGQAHFRVYEKVLASCPKRKSDDGRPRAVHR